MQTDEGEKASEKTERHIHRMISHSSILSLTCLCVSSSLLYLLLPIIPEFNWQHSYSGHCRAAQLVAKRASPLAGFIECSLSQIMKIYLPHQRVCTFASPINYFIVNKSSNILNSRQNKKKLQVKKHFVRFKVKPYGVTKGY